MPKQGIVESTETKAISLLIVDDHPIVCEGLVSMVSQEPGFTVAGQAALGAKAIELYFQLKPNIVLLDLLLPDMSGIDVIKKVYSKSPTAQVIVLTSLCGDEDVYKALEAGARGYLLKDMVRRELFNAIRAVHAGSRYIPSEIGSLLAENLPRAGLSEREVEVLRLVATGMRNKEIAHCLKLAEATVNAHIKHIFEKLNVTDRTQAVTTGLRRGIIKL